LQSSRSHALIELEIVTDELVALREAAFVAEGTQFTCFTGTKVQILTLLPSSFVAKADLVPAGKGRDEYVMTIMSKQVIVLLALLVLALLAQQYN
jgi:hypothetical protein